VKKSKQELAEEVELLDTMLSSLVELLEEKSIEDTEVMADLVMRNIHLLSAPALEINGIVFIRY